MITGASRGLGRALAAGLAREGFALIIDARNAAALDAAADAIRAAGGTVTAIAGDVTDPAHRAALRQAADAAGRLDLLVNNAGTLGASPLPALADYPPDELRAAFEVNVIAPIALTQLMLPLLRAGGGAVLNITSDAAVEAYAGWGGYGAAKAALEQASNVLAAEELALRVWWADPGDLRTDMHQLAFPGEDISDRPEPESVVPAFVRLISQRLPSGRYRAAHLMPAGPVDPVRHPTFTLPAELEAHDPPEARGLARDGVRMLVSRRSSGEISHHGFRDLPGLLLPGDLLVVNTTATLPAQVRAGRDGLAVHFSSPRPDGAWLVELRQVKDKISMPNGHGFPGQLISLPVRGGPDPGGQGHRPALAGPALGRGGALPAQARRPHQVLLRAPRLGAAVLPDGVRAGAGQRGDAERQPPVHAVRGHRSWWPAGC